MLWLSQIKKEYRMGESVVNVLKGIDLHIEKNEFVAVMGPSGSGKSTLMNILGCLDLPSAGSYVLDGQEVSGLDDNQLSRVRNQRLGFVFQNFNLLSRYSALKNVALPVKYAPDGQDDALAKAARLLTMTGLGDRLHHRPSQLSGGECQRVAIARALINDPAIILADEPTGNLDSATALDIMALLTRLHQDGQTIVMVTHEPDIAEFAQRIIVLKDGMILQNSPHVPH
ncbi:MAG TPA: ABC transporter ATP-binding protein [Candidatus Aminicenantes bacterium]|nr:ABC transporter ATP-binding protein [Candidatus Aminicenantes bacterium]